MSWSGCTPAGVWHLAHPTRPVSLCGVGLVEVGHSTPPDCPECAAIVVHLVLVDLPDGPRHVASCPQCHWSGRTHANRAAAEVEAVEHARQATRGVRT